MHHILSNIEGSVPTIINLIFLQEKDSTVLLHAVVLLGLVVFGAYELQVHEGDPRFGRQTSLHELGHGSFEGPV